MPVSYVLVFVYVGISPFWSKFKLMNTKSSSCGLMKCTDWNLWHFNQYLSLTSEAQTHSKPPGSCSLADVRGYLGTLRIFFIIVNVWENSCVITIISSYFIYCVFFICSIGVLWSSIQNMHLTWPPSTGYSFGRTSTSLWRARKMRDDSQGIFVFHVFINFSSF